MTEITSRNRPYTRTRIAIDQQITARERTLVPTIDARVRRQRGQSRTPSGCRRWRIRPPLSSTFVDGRFLGSGISARGC